MFLLLFLYLSNFGYFGDDGSKRLTTGAGGEGWRVIYTNKGRHARHVWAGSVKSDSRRLSKQFNEMSLDPHHIQVRLAGFTDGKYTALIIIYMNSTYSSQARYMNMCGGPCVGKVE